MAILIDRGTRLLVQGITGREAATFTLESLRYGTTITAGVSPGKRGMEVHGVPVFDTVQQALNHAPCDASIISVPPPQALDAAEEALSHGIRLLVVITERIPRRDVVALLEMARSTGARVVGPNSLGVISPGESRAGMCGGAVDAVRRAYVPGPVGIVSRSGGMMTEIANLLTQAGIGQSTCVSVGGDPIVGTAFLDVLPLYEADPLTRALVFFCEPGGVMEEQLAAHLATRPTRLRLLAFVAGRFADRRPGTRFGHAGAIVEGTKGSPAAKAELLAKAGVQVVEKLGQIPMILRDLSSTNNGHIH